MFVNLVGNILLFLLSGKQILFKNVVFKKVLKSFRRVLKAKIV
jgi:hypothetical protein